MKKTSYFFCFLLVLCWSDRNLSADAGSFASTENANQHAAGSRNSTVLLSENFDYGNVSGALTSISEGVWNAHASAGVGEVQYITSSLTLPGYGASGVGGAAAINLGGAEDVHASFANQTKGVVYYAALTRVNTATASGDYFLHLSNTGTGFRGRVFVRDNDGVLEYGLGGVGTYATKAFAFNTTYLVVVRYLIGSGDTDLYVLDAVPTIEPAAPLVSVEGTAELAVQRIAIRQGAANSRPAVVIDGIRVANTWVDVIGDPIFSDRFAD